jgi:ferredoxin hydrogenase
VRGSDGFRAAAIQIGDLTLKVGVVTNLKNIDPIIERLKDGTLDCHFVEVMTCPEGCITGGGQPKLLSDEDRGEANNSRRRALYEHDRALPKRKSHESAAIQKIYAEFLEQPNSHKAHELLHTHYRNA